MSEFNRGMIEAEKKYAAPVHPDLQNYLDTRHLPSKAGPYVPPGDNGQMQPYKSTLEAATDLTIALAKPVFVLSVVAGGVYTVVAVVGMAVGAAFAFVSANAVWIGGGVFALAAIILSVGSLGGSSEPLTNGQTSQSAPTINVVVNVAGQNVSNGTK